MPLESIPSMLRRAVQEGYAVGYFESWNLESLQGVVDAAEQTMSPVILGFNGGFLSGLRHATQRFLVCRLGTSSSRVRDGTMRAHIQRMPFAMIGFARRSRRALTW